MSELTRTRVPLSVVGKQAKWFTVVRSPDAVTIRPNRPLPCRCTIRPAALFEQDRGFPDVNTVMGRLVFASGATKEQCYMPFTRDPHRHLRELFFRVEAMPDDDWASSAARWSLHQTIAHRLLQAADVPWNGLAGQDVDQLVRFIPWPEPLEGCALHALTQWTHHRGGCVMEIGSFRGRSLSMIAMALRGVESDALVISVDPHDEQPHNSAHVRLALSQIGVEKRLVQFPCTSDQVWKLLRPQAASLIFVDGNHAFSQVVSDFRHYRELLAPGGCMLFHDYGYGDHNHRPEADPEVRPAVDEHVFPAKGFRPLLLAHTLMAFVKEGGE